MRLLIVHLPFTFHITIDTKLLRCRNKYLGVSFQMNCLSLHCSECIYCSRWVIGEESSIKYTCAIRNVFNFRFMTLKMWHEIGLRYHEYSWHKVKNYVVPVNRWFCELWLLLLWWRWHNVDKESNFFSSRNRIDWHFRCFLTGKNIERHRVFIGCCCFFLLLF